MVAGVWPRRMAHVGRGIDRQPEAVKQFFETLALTPAGSIVEMNGRPMVRVLPAEIGPDSAKVESWTPDLNHRRCDLIDKKYSAGLTPGEETELATLTAGLRAFVDRHLVTVDGEPVQLPLKEFDLLELLLRNVGRVLTRGQIIDRVWGSDYVGDTKTLDVHVKRLRAKIEPDPTTPRLIVTVRGLGYKFETR